VSISRQFLGFALVGTAGFLTDAAVFLLLTQFLSVPVLPARALAFAPASLVTWLLNRVFVFRTSGATGRKRDEYARHMLVQGTGIAINFGCFWLAVRAGLGAGSAQLLPLAIGSGVAMLFNFAGSRGFVFRHAARTTD
jgi:putative flippase GtrA